MKCKHCLQEKPSDDFAFRYKESGIRHKICKSCAATYSKQRRERHAFKSTLSFSIQITLLRIENERAVLDVKTDNPSLDRIVFLDTDDTLTYTT
jgi:protein-arginine kinase activator protein McsA